MLEFKTKCTLKDLLGTLDLIRVYATKRSKNSENLLMNLSFCSGAIQWGALLDHTNSLHIGALCLWVCESSVSDLLSISHIT